MQMLEWTQTMVEVGEAFSGAKAVSLRDALSAQSGRFFNAYHAANLQARMACVCHIVLLGCAAACHRIASGADPLLTLTAVPQALHMMLDKELWQRLPLGGEAQLPNLHRALQGTREAAASAQAQTGQDPGNFAAWLAQGNPWARQTSGQPSGRSSAGMADLFL